MATKPARTLSQRELNRAVLARQLLLERDERPVPRVLEAMGGVQAQYAPAMYVGLWSRVAGLERDEVTRALADRSIIQATLLRSTIHVVSAEDYWLWAAAIREPRRQWYARIARGVSVDDTEAAAKRLRDALRDGPMSRADLDAVVKPSRHEGVAQFIDLVRVPPSGTWERPRANLFALAEGWLAPSSVGAADVTPREGVDLLVRRYLTAFGPAAKADIASWAGLPARTVTEALSDVELRHFRSEDGKALVDLPDLPLPDADTLAPVRFLAVWDAVLLTHARRTQILPEQYRSRIFNTKRPHSFNTFLVDGAVAGSWRYEDGRIVVEPFGRLAKAVRAELDDEAARLAAFHA